MTPYDPYIAYKDLTVDLRAHRVRRAGCELCLTPREFALLAVLVTHCDKALSRSQLLEAAWGYAFIGESRTVDVHINRLRRKLGLETTSRPSTRSATASTAPVDFPAGFDTIRV